MRPIRLAVIGAGYFGSELARIAARNPAFQLTHVVDPHRGAQLAQELGASYRQDERIDAITDQIDALIIATPNHAHAAPALAAARAGVHVFCEKPIALSQGDCEAMVSAAKQAGVVFMAGHVTRFMPGVREAITRIRAGEIGELLLGHTARTGWEPAASGAVSWKKQRAYSGGHLFHHIHELDLLQAVMGTPKRATMIGGNYVHHGAGHGDEDDIIIATLEFDGAVAIAEWGSAMHWPEHYALFSGTAGAIRIDLSESLVTLRDAKGNTRSWPLHGSDAENDERRSSYAATSGGGGVTYGKPSEQVPTWLCTIMEEELQLFAAAITGDELAEDAAALLDGSAATSSITTAAALERSLRTHTPITLATPGD